MKQLTVQYEKTRERLIHHYQNFPKLQTEDIFKYLFQSAFGCEHLVSDKERVLEYIQKEYAALTEMPTVLTDKLDGGYTRVYLSCLSEGIRPETLAKLFYLSAKKEPDGRNLLEEKIRIARELISHGDIPLDLESFDRMLAQWRDREYPAVHHSEAFRLAYRPAYRVIADRYADHLETFFKIDKLLSTKSDGIVIKLEQEREILEILQEVYDCTVIRRGDSVYFDNAT